MSFLEKFFGIYTPKISRPPTMTSVLPEIAVKTIQQGKLPILKVSTLVLAKGEVCHYVDEACMVTSKIERHYQRHNNGMSFKITRGTYYHWGEGNSRPIEYEIPVYTKGYLYITSKRITFVSKKEGLDKRLESISAITSYSDAIGLQFGEKICNIMIPSAVSARQVLKLLGK